MRQFLATVYYTVLALHQAGLDCAVRTSTVPLLPLSKSARPSGAKFLRCLLCQALWYELNSIPSASKTETYRTRAV
jgi:hypothetical protein